MDIKEIALKVADSLRNKVDGISHMQSNQGLVAFAEALVTEIANETAWQPIETAPKDGTVFLGYKLGQFRECYKVPRDDCDMWCFGGVSGADDPFPNIKPTHWMPLQTPPKRSMEGV